MVTKTKPIRISEADGLNPRTVVIPRFPSFYSKEIDDEMKAIAKANDLEIVRIIYDDHFFGFGFLQEDELLN